MRTAKVLACTALTFSLLGCEWAAKKATEKAIGAATGSEVDLDEGSIKVKDKDGKEATIEFQGNGKNATMRVRDKDGKESTVEMTGEGETASMKVTGPDGDAKWEMNQKVPEGFPLPVVDHAKVVQSMNVGGGDKKKVMTLALQLEEGASIDDVFSFYEKHFKEKGYEINTSDMNMGEARMRMLMGKSKDDKINAGVQMMVDKKKNKTVVNLTWTEKP